MENLKPLISAYLKQREEFIENEIYKWNAFKHFHDVFHNLNETFSVRINNCFTKHVNLLDSRNYYPLAVLLEVYKEKPEATENLILNLFDEKQPLEDRINNYMHGFNGIVRQMEKEGYEKWKQHSEITSYQDPHSISVYLAMRHPERYYIYKYGIFKAFSNIVGYNIKNTNKVDRYIEYNQLCEAVKKELTAYTPLISTYKRWLKKKGFKDNNYNLLTQDFIYAVAIYLNNESYSKKLKNKKIYNKEQIIEVHDFQSNNNESPQSFVGVKDIDYAERNNLFHGIGLMGEEWAITYEKERLRKKNINFNVRHSSILDGDGIGYDILSVEDDGETPRYIEVKTTTGSVKQPFYYSDNELEFSEQNKDHYYVYRVYNFKSATNIADVFIIHGSLKELNGKPTNYKVSVTCSELD